MNPNIHSLVDFHLRLSTVLLKTVPIICAFHLLPIYRSVSSHPIEVPIYFITANLMSLTWYYPTHLLFVVVKPRNIFLLDYSPIWLRFSKLIRIMLIVFLELFETMSLYMESLLNMLLIIPPFTTVGSSPYTFVTFELVCCSVKPSINIRIMLKINTSWLSIWITT